MFTFSKFFCPNSYPKIISAAIPKATNRSAKKAFIIDATDTIVILLISFNEYICIPTTKEKEYRKSSRNSGTDLVNIFLSNGMSISILKKNLLKIGFLKNNKMTIPISKKRERHVERAAPYIPIALKPMWPFIKI